MFEMLDHNGPGHFGSSFALGFSEPNFVKKLRGITSEPTPNKQWPSATSTTSFELIEDQALTAEEVEMASQEAQEVRTREAAVAAGLVLDEPEAPPSASATDVMNDLSSGLVASAAGRLPQPLSAGDLADLWDSLWLLIMAAADGKLSENFSPLENEWDRQDQLRRDDPPPLQQPELLKWRHWRPGKIREMEPATQRALELHMRVKWAERLLAHFAPFAEHIAYMQDILGEDFRKEALDLLGDSRFRTLRQHCLVYESLRKRGFTVIPWMSVLSSTSSPMRRSPRASCGRCGTPSSGFLRPSDC